MSAAKPELSITDDLIATLTRNSFELLDWHNVGGLARQRTNESYWGLWASYSWRELITRGGIIITTGFCAYLAANSYDDEVDEHRSQWLKGLAGGLFGFTVSHSVALYPTIKRRYAIKQKTKQISQEINTLCAKIEAEWSGNDYQGIHKITNAIKQCCEEIISMNLPLAKRADNIRNLVFRKNSIKLISDKILEQFNSEMSDEDIDNISQFWSQSTEEILRYLVPVNEPAYNHSMISN